MTTAVLHSFQFNRINLTKAYLTMFTVFAVAVCTRILRTDLAMADAALELKIWILSATLTLMMAVVAYFLKRLLDSFDAEAKLLNQRMEKTTEQQHQTNLHIANILNTIAHHRDRLDGIDRKLDSARRD